MSDVSTEPFTLQEYFTPEARPRLRRFPHLVKVSFGIVWRAAPRELIEIIVLQVITALGLAGELLLVRNLLSNLIDVHSPSFSTVAPEIIGISVIGLAVGMAGVVLGLRAQLLGQLVALDATDAVVRTAIGVDLITYDVAGFHDRLQRAQLAAATRPAQMVQELIGAAGASIAIAGIVIALAVIEPLFAAVMLVAFIPTWLATNRAGKLSYRQNVEQTERERKRQYLFDLLTTKQPAQELRAFGTGTFLADRQRELYTSLIEEVRTVLRRRMRIALAGQAASPNLARAPSPGPPVRRRRALSVLVTSPRPISLRARMYTITISVPSATRRRSRPKNAMPA
jgi:ATP-binding cassette subfamily B protein